MNEQDSFPVTSVATAARLVQLGLQVLSMRSIILVQLALNAAAFAWALSTANWTQLAGAVLFALANWCVVHVRPPTGERDEP